MATAQPDLLAVVERSPRAAGAHDRSAWVGLFTDDGRIEDPVGSRPHVGRTQIGRFYDTFIAPRDITFHRDLDIVRGPTVVRDVDLEVGMGGAVTMHIPAFLRYDLRAVDGDWKFARLRAYWELPAMMLQFLRNGAVAVPPTVALARELLRNQRLAGTVGFATGFRRAGARHKNLVARFVTALGRGDTATAAQSLAAGARVSYGDDGTADLAELADRLAGVSAPMKIVGAGSTVALSVTSGHRRGVLFAEVPLRGRAIERVRYFPADPEAAR